MRLTITRLKGVETELHHLNELIEILLTAQGLPTRIVPPASKEDGGVNYIKDGDLEADELRQQYGLMPIEDKEEPDGTVVSG